METEALKNYPFTLLERQLVSRPVLGNLARLKDSGSREGKHLQCRHLPHLTGKDHLEPMRGCKQPPRHQEHTPVYGITERDV